VVSLVKCVYLTLIKFIQILYTFWELDRVLQAFTAGLLLITISELGDKTFFIAMCLAMRHSRRLVLAGAVSALSAMTIISVAMGQTIALLPKPLIHYGEVILFLAFGLKLLYDASQMSVACADHTLAMDGGLDDCATEAERAAAVVIAQAEAKLKIPSPGAIYLEAFMLVFIGELGDRTQFATITLAAAHHPGGVALGAIAGHTLCTLIAVIGGRLIAGRISERMVTLIGGVLFLVFAAVAWFEP
jgi:Ca2+/H+ antiporter, TMEM165/GDT1 family